MKNKDIGIVIVVGISSSGRIATLCLPENSNGHVYIVTAWPEERPPDKHVEQLAFYHKELLDPIDLIEVYEEEQLILKRDNLNRVHNYSTWKGKEFKQKNSRRASRVAYNHGKHKTR